MTVKLRICLLINFLLITQGGQIFCTKLRAILLPGIGKNTTDPNPKQNDISTSFYKPTGKPETIEDSKEIPTIIGSSKKAKTDKKHVIPDIIHSINTSTSRISTTSVNSYRINVIPDVNNTNLISKDTVPNIITIKVIHGVANTPGSGSYTKEQKTSKVGELTPLSNNNLIYKIKKYETHRRYGSPEDKKPPEKSELQPEGYIYDLNNCQYIDNRVLCGYDKNPEPPKRKEVVDLDDLCRKHGDRIECGYVTGPFPDAYNPDPEKDKIAKINLANYYNNIARSGKPDDLDKILRSGNAPIVSLLEIFKLRSDMSKLLAALSPDMNFAAVTDSTAPTLDAISATTITTSTSALTRKVTNENSRPNITLSEILSKTFELNLASITTRKSTTTIPPGKTREKKCVEKDGRMFCATV